MPGSCEVRGSRANPYTAGVICTKVATSYPDWVHGPGRLLTPLRRVGAKGEGRFARASWDEALDIIHDRFTAAMAAHGPESVLPLNYAGPHGMLAYAAMDLRFFHKLGASLLDRSPLCGGIRSQAWMGTFGAAPGIAPEQVRLAKADHRVGQQRHLVEPPPDAHHQCRPAQRGQGGGGGSQAHQDRRAGGSAYRAQARHRRGARVGGGGRAGAPRWPRPRLHRAPRGGLRALHGAGAPGLRVRSGADLRGARGADSPARRVVPHALARRHQRGQRARAQPERRQRHSRHLRPARAGGKVRRAGGRARQWRGPRLPQDAGAPAASRLRAAGHAHPQHRRRGTRTCSIRRSPRPSRRSSSTTTTRSSCTPTRTACAAASPARTCSWWAATW